MDIVTTICVFLMLFGILHTKDWRPEIYAEGENATVFIDQLQINGNKVLEITFSCYTSKLDVTNVMMYGPKKNQTEYIYINTKYIGRIQNIKMNNGNLSFLLLNVNFMDSGNYTVFEDSIKKGNASILVPRQILLGQDSGPMILPFVCNITNISSIKIEIMLLKQKFPVVKYDIAQRNCTEFGNLYMDRIESCVLRGNNFSFTIRKVSLLDIGMYVVWDDMDFLMDSVFVHIQEGIKISSMETSSANGSLDSSKVAIEHDKLGWLFVSAVVTVLVAAGLIITAVGKFRQRRGIKKVKKNSPSRVDRSTFYSNGNQKRLSEINCAGSSVELGSHDFRKKLTPPSAFE